MTHRPSDPLGTPTGHTLTVARPGKLQVADLNLDPGW